MTNIVFHVAGKRVTGAIDSRFASARITWACGRTYLGTFGRLEVGTWDDLALLMSLVARAIAKAEGDAEMLNQSQDSISSLVSE